MSIRRLLFFLVLLAIQPGFAQDSRVLQRSWQNEQNPTRKFWRLYALSEYYLKNDVSKADSIRDPLLSASRAEGDSARLSALVYDIEVDKLLGKRFSYSSKILQLQPFLNVFQDGPGKVKIYHYLAEYHILRREYEQAGLYLNEAEKIGKKSRNYNLLGKTYLLYGWFHMEQNHRHQAQSYIDQAIQYSRRSTDKALLAASFNMQSKIYSWFGELELSVSKNLIALQLALEAGDFPNVSDYQRELGESQVAIRNFSEAMRNFNLASETGRKIRDNRLVALVLYDIAQVNIAKGKYEQATLQLRESIRILQTYQDDNGLGYANMYLGNVYLQTHQYNDALRYYNSALVHFESAANRSQIATVYYLVGSVFEKQGKYENALNYLERSVAIRSEFGFTGSLYSSYRAIAEVYKKKGNIREAYYYLELYSNYSDSARTVEVSAKIAEISELYRSEQLERMIAMQADSIELQRREKALTSVKLENTELRNIFQTYVIIGIILIVVFGLVIFNNRNRQRNILQAQREAEMAQTLLRSQMNPHFVFNAMSVIQSYIYENDTKNSSKFLVNFSKLMRLILENSSKEFIPLNTEIDILTKYLETQKLRFVDRFEFAIIADPQLLEEELVIPPMITQPFIENAIEHGQLHTIDGGGFINIFFTRRKGLLHVKIEDNGIGRKGAEQNKKSKEHKSMAMKITQERIDNLSNKYKVSASLKISDYDEAEGTGTRVEIDLPYRTENNGK